MDTVDTRDIYRARDDLGSLWTNFEETLVPETAQLLNTAYTLIVIVPRENNLSTQLTPILIDENIENSERTNYIRRFLIETMVGLLMDMGVVINKEYVDLDSLKDLINILDTLYTTDQVEDVLGIIYILDNETYSNKDKLITTIVKTLELDEEGQLEYIIEDVSADVIKGLYIGFGAIDIDDVDYLNPEVRDRIRKNRLFLQGTLASQHITNGGGVGFSFEAYTNLFINEIGIILIKDKEQYFKEVLALLLISSETTGEIENIFEQLAK